MKRTRGVSLLEIIIAMQCVALLLVFVSRALPLARRQMRDADRRLGGAIICQNILEEYLTVPIAEWPQEPIKVANEPYKAQLEVLPWEQAQELKVARVTLLLGEEEIYRLDTVVIP